MPALTWERRANAVLIGIASPPVNAFSQPVREQLYLAVRRAQADTSVAAIVLHGTGRGFSAGGDIKEFGAPQAMQPPGLSTDLQPLLELSRKPVVAAIHGFALGGGLETAMACHYRVSSRSAKVGLPEVGIGLIPLSGTQRLPRLVGLARAAEMIVRAEKVAAASLETTALFDALVDEDSAPAVLRAALDLIGDGTLKVRRTRDLRVHGNLPSEATPAAALPERLALRALHASDTLPFDAAMDVARTAYEECYRARSHDRPSGDRSR